MYITTAVRLSDQKETIKFIQGEDIKFNNPMSDFSGILDIENIVKI